MAPLLLSLVWSMTPVWSYRLSIYCKFCDICWYYPREKLQTMWMKPLVCLVWSNAAKGGNVVMELSIWTHGLLSPRWGVSCQLFLYQLLLFQVYDIYGGKGIVVLNDIGQVLEQNQPDENLGGGIKQAVVRPPPCKYSSSFRITSNYNTLISIYTLIFLYKFQY